MTKLRLLVFELLVDFIDLSVVLSLGDLSGLQTLAELGLDGQLLHFVLVHSALRSLSLGSGSDLLLAVLSLSLLPDDLSLLQHLFLCLKLELE